MLKFTIENVPPLDGEHLLDPNVQFNGRELHLIKNVAGVRLGEINEALAARDYDVFVAFAVIALVRNARVDKRRANEAVDLLMEAEGGAVKFEEIEDEEPASDAVVPPPSELESVASENES